MSLSSSAVANHQDVCTDRIAETDALIARDFRNSRTVPAELRCKSTALARRMIDQQDMIDGPALAVVKRIRGLVGGIENIPAHQPAPLFAADGGRRRGG